MSRVGKYPVKVPQGVSVTVAGDTFTAKGKLGEMSYRLTPEWVDVAVDDGAITVTPKTEHKRARMMWGTTRAQIQNVVTGVSEGFTKKLEIVGVGYRAQMQGKTLQLSLGYSHDIPFAVPEGIEIKTPQPTQIEISGMDKRLVGEVASKIRQYRLPEPYKGKGVRYAGEQILRKEGKKK